MSIRRLVTRQGALADGLSLGVLAAAGACLILIGAMIAIAPWTSAIVFALITAVVIVFSPAAALTFFVVGGLVAFQSSNELDLTKFAYFGGAGLASVGAVGRMISKPVEPKLRKIRNGAVALSMALLVPVGLALTLAPTRPTPLIDVVRDAAPYMLVAIAPVVAFDAGTHVGRRSLVALTVSLTACSALLFASAWIARRDLADLAAGQVGLASFMLPAAGFAYSSAAILAGHRGRLRWSLLALAILGALLLTGTRSSVIMLAAPVVIVFAMPSGRGQRLTRLAAFAIGGIALFVAVGPWLASTLGLDLGRLSERLGSALLLFGNPLTDRSYAERLVQTKLALDAWASSPIFGVGLGHRFEWVTTYGTSSSTFNIDTGLAYLAKFGVAGVLLLAGAAAVGFKLVRSVVKARRSTIPVLALTGWISIAAVWIPFAVPLEDKGFALALALIGALVIRGSNAIPRSVVGSVDK
jgi:hypothetical protein